MAESTEAFILEVEKYPQLYNPKSDGYKDGKKKEDVWKAIGTKMGMTGRPQTYCFITAERQNSQDL